MHRTDGDSNVAGLFDAGDPGVPREPTQVDADWLNAVQEEIVGVVLDAGIALVKGTNTQLLSGLRTLFVRASGSATQTITGIKNFTSRVTSILAPGASNANVRIEDLDTTNDSNALFATSTSVGTTARIANTSTGRALQLQTADGVSTLRIVPGTTLPASPSAGDIVYLAGAYNKLYVYDGTAWNACW